MSIRGIRPTPSEGKKALLEILNGEDPPVASPLVRLEIGLGLLDLIAEDLDLESRRSEAHAVRLCARLIRACVAGEEVEIK